jgi:hypothetical protein
MARKIENDEMMLAADEDWRPSGDYGHLAPIVVERREIIATLMPGEHGMPPVQAAMQAAAEYMESLVAAGEQLAIEFTVGGIRVTIEAAQIQPTR